MQKLRQRSDALAADAVRRPRSCRRRPRYDRGRDPGEPTQPTRNEPPERDDEGPDPLLRRPAGRRQDVARPVDRARDEPQVRAHLARRRARRGGDPRPPAHLHRVDARPAGPGAEDGGLVEPGVDARRDRQDLGRRPGRSGRGAARGARPGAEPRVPRSLPRDPDRSVARAVHRHREPARHDPSGAARSHGDHLAQRLHRGREGPHRADVPDPAAARRARPRSPSSWRSPTRRCGA